MIDRELKLLLKSWELKLQREEILHGSIIARGGDVARRRWKEREKGSRHAASPSDDRQCMAGLLPLQARRPPAITDRLEISNVDRSSKPDCNVRYRVCC